MRQQYPLPEDWSVVGSRALARCWRNIGATDRDCALAKELAEQMVLWRSGALMRWRRKSVEERE